MPPKAKVTREMILDAAFDLVRSEGQGALNVRALARRLVCSTQPILYNFATMEALTRKLNGQTEFTLNTADYKKPRSPAPSEILEPWYKAKYFSIGHEEKLTEELFSRDIVDRLKTGYEFLLPYYDYFLTLSGEAEPTQL